MLFFKPYVVLLRDANLSKSHYYLRYIKQVDRGFGGAFSPALPQKRDPSPDATHASEIPGTLFSELSSAYAAQSKIPGLVRGTSAALGRQSF